MLAALFGAAHPERTSALMLYGGWGCTVGDEAIAACRVASGSTSSPRRPALMGRHGPVSRAVGTDHEHDPAVRDWWTRALHRGASPAPRSPGCG